jgi:Bacteriophage probable baseplate hub protein
MDFKEIEKKNFNFYAPGFEIEIEGENVLEKGVPITSVEVKEKSKENGSFTLQISDKYDVNTETFEWLDNPIFHVGKEVTIKMGYGSNLQTMMIGKIENINSSLFSTGSPTLRVVGYSLGYNLKKSSNEQTFNNTKDSEIAQKIADENALNAVVDPTHEKYKKIIKKSDTNYFDFLKERAKRIGYAFDVREHTLYFVIPKEDKAELFTLEWGKSLISFNPIMSTAGVVTEVEVRGWDEENKKEIVGKAVAGDERTQEKGKKKASECTKEAGGDVKKVIFCPVSSVTEAKTLAKAILNKASDGFVRGSGTTIGIPELRTGVIIKIDKLGKRFSGKYFVNEATHTIDNGGYRVNFTGKRNAI